jgi:hypothetical protein
MHCIYLENVYSCEQECTEYMDLKYFSPFFTQDYLFTYLFRNL